MADQILISPSGMGDFAIIAGCPKGEAMGLIINGSVIYHTTSLGTVM